MTGPQEDKWRHVTPFESSIVALACCYVYLHYFDQCKSHGQTQHQGHGRLCFACFSWCHVKSPGQGRGYTILTLSAHEELRMTIYSTAVHSFVYVLYPSHRPDKLTLIQETAKSVMAPGISFVFIWNLVARDWGAVDLKTNHFPLPTRHAVKERGRVAPQAASFRKGRRRRLSLAYSNSRTPWACIAWPLTLGKEHFSLLA